jgi:hypothetical protein
MTAWAQGKYTLKNPQKYLGKGRPKYRSSWEKIMFDWADNNPGILNWTSEGIKIPYINPLTGKKSNYIPDMLIVYQDKTGQNKAEILEIKPMKETVMEAAGQSKYNRAMVILNAAKWQAARAYCASLGIGFRILTEQDLFHSPAPKKRKK